MKQLSLVFCFTVFVFLIHAQKKLVTNEMTSYDYKKEFSTAKESVLKINQKKSKDLISIKAFRKATQLRSKPIRIC